MGRRWRGAALVLAVLAGCEADRESVAPSPVPSPAPATSQPVSETRAAIVADFAVAPAAPGTELSTVSAATLEAGRGSVVLVAAERPRVAVRCMAGARLRMFLHESSDLVTEELGVYPSHVFTAATKRDGEPYGYSGALLDVRPRALYEDAGSGWSEWDVTGIVKRWVGGRPFPSQGLRAPARGPIVLALRDVDGAEPFATATIASVEATKNRPHLVLARLKGCR